MTGPQNPWPKVDPAKLRHQVTINQQISTPDAFGQPVLKWTPIRSTSAGINVVSMREAFGEGQLTSQKTDIWTMRWTPTVIQPEMRLVFGDSEYRILVVNDPDKRKVYLHLLCLELNANSGA